MKDITLFLRFLLGGGWWILWYSFFHFVVITGNFVWFNELYSWTIQGESGPAAEAIFIGLMALGGLPLLFFTFIHLVFAFWRCSNNRKFIGYFGLVLLLLLTAWMVAGPLCIAGALFAGFVAYYLFLVVFIFVNLALLWAARHKYSLQMWFSL